MVDEGDPRAAQRDGAAPERRSDDDRAVVIEVVRLRSEHRGPGPPLLRRGVSAVVARELSPGLIDARDDESLGLGGEPQRLLVASELPRTGRRIPLS